MNTPNLRKLYHALVLEDTESYARASEKLHLSQSALTRSIQSLEEEIGLRLFDRSQRGVAPTPDGRTILAQARQLILQANTFSHELDTIKQVEKGQVAVGFGPGMQSLFLPDLLVTVCRQRPGLSVSVHVDGAQRLAVLLLEEELEFFVADTVHLDAGEALLEADHLASLPLGLFVRSGHPLAGKKVAANQRARALRDYPAVTGQFGSRVQTHTPVIRCNDLTTLGEVVKNTDGIFIGLDQMVTTGLDTGDIVRLPFSPPGQSRVEIALIKLKNRTLSGSAALIDGLIRQFIKAGAPYRS